MLTAGVLGDGRVVNSIASCTLRPLSWALTGVDDSDYFNDRGWLDVSDWLRYGHDRTNQVLRWLTPTFTFDSTLRHRMGSDDAFQLFSDEITPYMEGDISFG